MKKKSTTPASETDSKIDAAFLPKARVLIKKIKAKLKQLKAGPDKNSPKKKPAPTTLKKAAKPKARAR